MFLCCSQFLLPLYFIFCEQLSVSLLILNRKINSLRNKREFLEPLIRNDFDIFLVNETKLGSSFPGSEFTIPGYRLFRKDRNQVFIFYVNQNIPYITINTFNFPNSLKVLLLEINLRNKKLLVIG